MARGLCDRSAVVDAPQPGTDEHHGHHDPAEPKPLVRLRDVGKIYDDDGLQEPATRHQLFVRGAWPRALGSRLELSGFALVDVLDGSTLAQTLVSFYPLQVVR
jgi:hypothetical protein